MSKTFFGPNKNYFITIIESEFVKRALVVVVLAIFVLHGRLIICIKMVLVNLLDTVLIDPKHHGFRLKGNMCITSALLTHKSPLHCVETVSFNQSKNFLSCRVRLYLRPILIDKDNYLDIISRVLLPSLLRLIVMIENIKDLIGHVNMTTILYFFIVYFVSVVG